MTGSSPSWSDDHQWQRWWQRLPKPVMDSYMVRCSPRTNRTKALLDESKAGLLFVDATRFGHVIRVRELLLRGSHMQALPDRGDFVWSLFACDDKTVAEQIAITCLEQVPSLVAPKDIGRYLEVCNILNQQPFNPFNDWPRCVGSSEETTQIVPTATPIFIQTIVCIASPCSPY